MNEEDFQSLLNHFARHNAAIERLLIDPDGRRELARFVENELALFGYLLEAAESGAAAESGDETPEEEKRRWIDRAKEWLDKNGKDIFKELLIKANNLIAAAPLIGLSDERKEAMLAQLEELAGLAAIEAAADEPTRNYADFLAELGQSES